MDLIRMPHFRKFVEDTVAKCWIGNKGLSDAEARAKFRDTFYEDYNMLSFIIANTYPHTKRVGDLYEFITDDIEHIILPSYDKGNGFGFDYRKNKILKDKENVGRMRLVITGGMVKILFENKGFKHGHISTTGGVTCYGDYHNFDYNVVEIGFSGAIMDCYNFARVSRYGTSFPSGKAIAG